MASLGRLPAADTNGDGVVDTTDLLVVLAAYGSCPAGPRPADVEADGAVDFGDLVAVIADWT